VNFYQVRVLLLDPGIGLGETVFGQSLDGFILAPGLLSGRVPDSLYLLQDEDKRLPYLINDQQALLGAHRSIWSVTGQAQSSLILREVRALFYPWRSSIFPVNLHLGYIPAVVTESV
jgi:hypothetical protein